MACNTSRPSFYEYLDERELNYTSRIYSLLCRSNLIFIEFQTEGFKRLLHRVLLAKIINERVSRKCQNYFSVVQLRHDRPNRGKWDLSIATLIEKENCPIASTAFPNM